MGQIVELGPSRVVVEDRNGRRFWLDLAPSSRITLRGQRSSALAFSFGTQVRVTFATDRSGRRIISRCDVLQ